VRRRAVLALAATAVAVATAVAGWGVTQTRTNPIAPPSITPAQLLSRPIPTSAPNAAQLRLGRNVVIAGDCVSCHTRDNGEPMAGGLGMHTPFGVIYTPNITPDKDTGIGGWTPDQFYGAMHRGMDDEGHPLYPAFPYVYFTRISRQDSDAALAYLKTVPPVRYTAPDNKLPFPFNIRFLVRGWNLLFFRRRTFQADPARPAQWNRGAFLVNGPGHCAQCHTPTNFLGANENSKAFRGGALDNWVAPDLTGNARTGLGSWNAAQVVEYLKSGRNDRTQAAGPMAEVVSYSTSLLSDADLAAIASYLKTLPASPAASVRTPEQAVMNRGAAIYSDACASCHLERGVGQPRYFPPLGNDAVVQQDNPVGLIHMILAGVRTAPTTSRPTPLSMPSFAWKLSDQEIADVATFLRNSWGNRAAPVDAGRVGHLRHALGLDHERLTPNSGDHY
jgi:mono/diheme cytochrome c family protein